MYILVVLGVGVEFVTFDEEGRDICVKSLGALAEFSVGAVRGHMAA